MSRHALSHLLPFAVLVAACGDDSSTLFGEGGSEPSSSSSGAGAGAPTSSAAGDPTSSAAGDPTSSAAGDPTSSAAGDPTSSSASGGDGGSGGQGAGGDPGTGGTGGTSLCGTVVIGEPIPAVVVLTLDASGSMAGGDGLPDKWGPTTSAVETLVDAAPADLEVGLVPFPAGDFDFGACLDFQDPECADIWADNGCEDVRAEPEVAIGPLSESGPDIVSWMQERLPEGGTPTYWALRRSYEIAAAEPARGDRFVVLFTDGDPNVFQPATSSSGFSFPDIGIECRDLAAIEQEVADAASATPPVRTYVVGAPGSEDAAPFLSRLAVAGETAPDGCDASDDDCHVQIGGADYEDDLAAALLDIAGKAAGCRFEVALDAPVDDSLVTVVLETTDGDVDIERDGDQVDGWDVVVDDPFTIELFGPPCELYRDAAANVVRVELTCE